MKIKFAAAACIILAVVFNISDLWAYLSADKYMEHGKSVFLLHGSLNTENKKLARERTGLPVKIQDQIVELNKNNHRFFFRDIENPEKTAVKIQKLRERYESSDQKEAEHNIVFNLALEYFKLYLYYLNVKYPYYADAKDLKKSELVYDKELFEYLSRAEFYINQLIYPDDIAEKGKNGNLSSILEASEDMSFKTDSDRYLSVYFLAFIIETERLAGNWPVLSENKSLNQKWMFMKGQWEYKNRIYSKKTRVWLNKLWKRYSLNISESSEKGTLANPDAELLFPLFDLYLKYDFLAQIVSDEKYTVSMSDTLTVSALKKASLLQKAYEKKREINYYTYLYELSGKDGGNTEFIPYLYFAYSGYPVTSIENLGISRNEMFKAYISLYDNALKNISYNIDFRQKIFRDIFFFGVDFNNLMYLENIIFSYAKRSAQVDNNSLSDAKNQNDISNDEGIVYLTAHILDLKRISSLNNNISKYEKIINRLNKDILLPDNSNWLYLGSIYRSFSEYYTDNNRGASNALSLDYAKKAFMTFCRQVSLKYQGNWQEFNNLENYKYGIEFANLFMKLRDKYPTNSEGILPTEYNADKILKEIQKISNSN
ncbi:MAG: hypothetical protein ACQEQS_06955 [Thermodesulfobacteriota bacterium]